MSEPRPQAKVIASITLELFADGQRGIKSKCPNIETFKALLRFAEEGLRKHLESKGPQILLAPSSFRPKRNMMA